MNKLLAILSLAATACAPLTQVGDKWNGRHVDTMISTLGPPPTESTLTDGSRVLEWRSYEGLGYDKQWCTVRVAVDPSGQIVSVAQTQQYACAFFLGRF